MPGRVRSTGRGTSSCSSAGSAPTRQAPGHRLRPRGRSDVWEDARARRLRPASRSQGRAPQGGGKPVALVADALEDATRRGELVLDAFLGSGTTLIQAHSLIRETKPRAAALD